jgi:hypothetical protein
MCNKIHWELFPGTRQIPVAIVKELTGMLVHAGYGPFDEMPLFVSAN